MSVDYQEEDRVATAAAQVPRRIGAVGSGSFRSVVVLVLTLSVLWIIECVAVNPVGNFPVNDDWIYALSVRALLNTGHFVLPTPSAANAMAQVYWGALFCLPFGFSFNALRLSTDVLGLVGVLALFALLLEAGASRRLAMIGALALAVSPLYLDLANSFMTDVPFLALALVSLWLYVRGCRNGSATWMFIAIGVAIIDILIRQFAVVLVGAIGCSYVVYRNFSRKSLLVGLGLPIAGLALHLLYAKWMVLTGRTPSFDAPLPKILAVPVGVFAKQSGKLILAGLPYVGFLTAPFLLPRLVPGVEGLSPRSRVAAIVAIAALSLGTIMENAYTFNLLPRFGNVLSISGLGPLSIVGPPIWGRVSIWLSLFWRMEIVMGAVAGVLALGLIAYEFWCLLRSVTRRVNISDAWFPTLILAAIIAYGLAFCVLGSIAPPYDRYFLPLAPLVCVLAARSARKLRSGAIAEVAAVLMLAVLAAFSIAATHDYIAFNRLRWEATADLQAHGVSPGRINGGYEYDGWYTNDPAFVGKPVLGWEKLRKEFLIAKGQIAGYRQVRQLQYWDWLHQSYGKLYVLHRDDAAQ